MADPDLARQLAEGHKVLSRLETEFSAKPPVPTALHAIQVRALAQFPGFLQTYSQPVIVNATVLKLADWFRTTNNVVRMHVYKVLKAMTRDQLAKVINIEETAKRLLPVTSSNDPVARTLTLRTLGCLASILGSNLNVQFGVLQSIQKATDRFEMEAAIWASDEICSQAASFLPVIFGRITALLTRSLSLSSSSDALSLKLECQLIHMLRHMHGNLAIAAQAKDFCVQLLEDRRDDETLVVALLRALSTFATFAIMYQAQQIDRLMHYALSDPRRRVQQTALQELKRLINDAPMDVDPFVVLLQGLAFSNLSKHVSSYASFNAIVHAHRATLISLEAEQQQQVAAAVDAWEQHLVTAIEQQHYTLAIACAQLLVSLVSIRHEAHDQLRNDDLFLKRVVAHVNDIPLDAIGTDTQKGKQLIGIKARLVRFMDEDACQDAFVTGLVTLMQQQHQILLPLLSCYAARLSSDYLADYLLRLLPDHASQLGSFSALLSLLFRHCAPSEEAVQLVRAQLDVFGQKSGDRYTRHAWQLYRIGITASQGAWYAIVTEIMHGLQPLVTSEAFAMWLSVLEEFAIAEQKVTLQQVDERKHVRLLTKLKGIQTLISVSSIQTGFVSLRMQWLYAVKHLATMLASFRKQQHAASGFKIAKMLIDHASRLRHLAHQYDLAIVKMKHMDADMKAQLIVYKLSALLLTFLCQVIAKASYDDPSFFPMRPMLLQTMVTDWRDGQQPFQQLCIHLMQQAEQWDGTRPVEEMVDAMQTFCSRVLCLPCPLPFSFFKMKRATAPPQSHVATV